MKISPELIRYASKQDYLAQRSVPSETSSLLKKKASDTVNISEKAQKKSLGDQIREAPRKIENKAKEGLRVGEKLLNEAGDGIKKAMQKIPGITNIPLPNISITANDSLEAEAPRKSPLIDQPGIFFVKGFSLNPFDTDEFGLTGMAENIPTAEVLNWDNEDELISKIKSRPHAQPILLIGHGMGGDSIVNVANKLNTVEHGFRRVDLAVTIDSIGSNNDIIPQNVRENLNFISDQDFFFNDGPNIARNKAMTKVSNELRGEDHSEIDQSPEVQFQIFDKINSVLKFAVQRKGLDEIHAKNQMNKFLEASVDPKSSLQNQLSNN